MLITYDDGRGARLRRMNAYLRTLIVGNLIFSACIVFFWPFVSGVLADVLSWATASTISRYRNLDELLTYPLNLLWMLPVLGSLMAWFMARMHWFTFGFFCVGFPLAMMFLAMSWYYLAPDTYL